ncbi:MAG: helix-turn-helix domain-containing protein [Anaerocolumna sp.]
MDTFYQYRDQPFLCAISNSLSYPAHLHKQVEIIYIISGETTITMNGETKTLKPKDLAIAYPNTIHSISSSEGCKMILLIFDIHLTEILSGNFLNKTPQSSFIQRKDLHDDVDYCLNSLLAIDKLNPDYILIKGYLTILLSRILKNLTLVENQSDDLDLVQRLLMYIDNHFTEVITLTGLAKQLNASKYYLSHIFNSKLGTTFHSYLNNQRIKYAKYLLVTSELSITDISYQCGFESIRTFYRTFKDLCNLTPKEYRTNHH